MSTIVSDSNAGLVADVAKSYEALTKEMGALAGVERVLMQTGDNVLDAKRRVEYGVHQILLEVGSLVKQQVSKSHTGLFFLFFPMKPARLLRNNPRIS